MMTNGLLVGYLLKPIGLVFWRQIIWLAGLLILYILILKNAEEKYRYNGIRKYMKITNTLICVFSFIALFISDYSLIRILFSDIQYVFSFSFLAMPYFFTDERNRKRLFRYFTLLGIFISVGLIIDSMSPVFESFKVKANAEERTTFFTEHATTMGLFYNFLLIALCYYAYYTKSALMSFFLILSSLLFIPGAWVTGSRQVLLIIMLTLACFYLYVFIKKAKMRLWIGLVFFVVSVFFYNSIITFMNNSNQSSRFEMNMIEDDVRYLRWIEGVRYFSINYVNYWLFGHGIGTTNDAQVTSDEYQLSHYENTYIARFIDTGYMGLFIFLFPVFYIIRLLLKNRFTLFSLLMYSFVTGYLIISFISPNGAHPLSTSTLFIVIGLLLHRDKFDIDFKGALKL